MSSSRGSSKSSRKKRRDRDGGGGADDDDGAGKNRGVFDAVDDMESRDRAAARKRRRYTATQRVQSAAAMSQQKIYGSLLETRILLQRAFRPAARSDSTVADRRDAAKRAVGACNELLVKLLRARRRLTTRDDGGGGCGVVADDEYRDLADRETTTAAKTGTRPTLSEALQSEYQRLEGEWQSVLNRRHKDARLHAGLTSGGGGGKSSSSSFRQFRVLDSSLWQQIEATAHREEMLNRQNHVQRGRKEGDDDDKGRGSDGDNGESDEEGGGEEKPDEESRDKSKIRSEGGGFYHAFDDAKVYQQLLKDFVSSHQASAADPQDSAARERRLQMIGGSKSSSGQAKERNRVDRRASKGRKIRYNEIPKLVNFTFPLSRKPTSGSGGGPSALLDEDAWFRSLFGGAGYKKAASDGAQKKRR